MKLPGASPPFPTLNVMHVENQIFRSAFAGLANVTVAEQHIFAHVPKANQPRARRPEQPPAPRVRRQPVLAAPMQRFHWVEFDEVIRSGGSGAIFSRAFFKGDSAQTVCSAIKKRDRVTGL